MDFARLKIARELQAASTSRYVFNYFQEKLEYALNDVEVSFWNFMQVLRRTGRVLLNCEGGVVPWEKMMPGTRWARTNADMLMRAVECGRFKNLAAAYRFILNNNVRQEVN